MAEDETDPPLTYATFEQIAAELQARTDAFVMCFTPTATPTESTVIVYGDADDLIELIGEANLKIARWIRTDTNEED